MMELGHYNVKSANIMAVNMEYSMNIVMIVNYSSITVNALQQNTVEKGQDIYGVIIIVQ